MRSPLRALFLGSFLIAIAYSALIYIPQIPVNQMNLYQLQVACNILEGDLNSNPNLPQSMAYKLYADTYMSNYFLQMVAHDPAIVNYNNIIYGQNNTISGNSNIIFGGDNTVYGTSNYIFSENFDSTSVSNLPISNNLVLDNWLIDLYKMYMIAFNPKLGIMDWTK